MIEEGLVKLKAPKDHLSKKHFFNPRMELARDLTILVLRALKPEGWVVCDALAGIGVRGIRIAKECGVGEVWLNDISEDAVRFIEENVELNSVKEKVKILREEANKMLSSNLRTFDYVDIDPFGSPSYYFDSCARAMKRKGFLGFSATDTAALCGTSPITCLRRYGIESYKTDFFKELGMRILIASAALAFSKWSFSFEPLLSYASEHYFRVFARVEKGKSVASRTLEENLGYVNYCPRCLWRSISESPMTECGYCGKKTSVIGKVWVTGIENREFIGSCKEELAKTGWLRTRLRMKRLLSFLEEESLPLYYDLHKLCKKHRSRIPPLKVLMEKLKERGYEAGRTHFSGVGIKTDASLESLIEIIRESS